MTRVSIISPEALTCSGFESSRDEVCKGRVSHNVITWYWFLGVVYDYLYVLYDTT